MVYVQMCKYADVQMLKYKNPNNFSKNKKLADSYFESLLFSTTILGLFLRNIWLVEKSAT
jgi:hypothetical protein